MGKVKLEHYKVAYQRFYNYVHHHHPEVIKEYRRWLKKQRELINAGIGLS